MNEVFGLLSNQENIPDSGLEELNLTNIDSKRMNWKDPFDESVLDHLASRCHRLKTLEILFVSTMPFLHRMQLCKWIG